jgi:hypothetical protein
MYWVLIIWMSVGNSVSIHSVPMLDEQACLVALDKFKSSSKLYRDGVCIKNRR